MVEPVEGLRAVKKTDERDSFGYLEECEVWLVKG